MKSIQSKGTMGKLFLAFSLLLGIGVMSSMTAQAQWGNDRNRSERRDNRRNNDDQWRRNRDNNGDWNNNGRGNRRGRNSDGYGNYGGSFDLRQTALNAGFADGVKEGRKDRQRGDRYDYTDEGAYQKGTRDFSSRLGDRYIYQRYYREAFSHGYADGYAGY